MGFLPKLFTPRWMGRGESEVFNLAGELIKEYVHGDWDYYVLSNGGGFMAPRMSGRVTVHGLGCGFDLTTSSRAAGVIVTVFVLSRLTQQTQSKALFERFEKLMEYVHSDPEKSAILSALD